MPPTRRRVGSTSSKTRARILEASEALMTEEGYAAVSSRSVAARVGINPGLVHYYFPTLDDLFIALVNRGAEKNLERLATALTSPQPLLAVWRLSSDRRGVALLGELMAAANHRKALRSEVVQLAQTARRMQVEALHELLAQYDVDEDRFPAPLVAAAVQGVGLLVAREASLGLETDHDTAADAMEALLVDLEQRRDPSAG